MAPIVLRANKEYDQLTEEEALRFVTICGHYFLAWEEAFVQHQEGRLADRSWNSLSMYYANGMGMPGIRQSWASRKKYFDRVFVEFVDAQDFDEYNAR